MSKQEHKSSGGGGGLFHRRPLDKRLVKQVTSLLHQPPGWLPMDLHEVECKLMEVRKYSAEYYDVDAKFRRPELQLITAYNVQAASAKERYLYYPANFGTLELIARNGFWAAAALKTCAGPQYARREGPTGTTFYATSELANQAMTGNANPRIMIVARVLVGVTETASSAPGASTGPLPYFSRGGRCIDTITISNKTFVKLHPSEAYPYQVLVYRDTTGLGDDRSSRLTGLIRHCQLSYRAGTRFNPDEVTFKGKQAVPAAAAPDKKKKDNLTIEVELNKEQRSFVGTGAVPKRRSRESTKEGDTCSTPLLSPPRSQPSPPERKKKSLEAAENESIEMSPMSQDEE